MVVEPNWIMFRIEKYQTEKDDLILLPIRHHSTPDKNTAHLTHIAEPNEKGSA